MVSNQEERAAGYANEFEWKFDGTFKDYPGNIMYEEPVAKK